MSKFFIRRPIVAMVIAILTVIVGAVTIAFLPVAQFPNIAPREIRLQANYPGADAKTLEDAVAVPMEQQVNGVDNMTYMYSLNATSNQQTTLIVDFDLKTDPNADLLLTQSREQVATGQLPPEVNSYGVTLKKSASAPLMLIAIYSPHGTHDANYLANYAYINLNDPVARSYGIGQTTVFGAGQYAMRLWVNPDQLAKLGITVTDIANAIKAQNTVNPAGQVGGEPAPANQHLPMLSDIRTAEQALVAANANIGVAKAMFFPQISLFGSGGAAFGHSAFLGGNIPAPLGVGSYAAGLTQPILQGGALRNNLRLAKSQDRQALISYQQTIQRAFGDVSDALIGYDKYHSVRERQEQTVKDLPESVDVSLMRYRGGTANYLDVLDSQRSLFQAELTLAETRNNEYQSLVQLYKALGGGWK